MPGEPRPNLEAGDVDSFRPDEVKWDAPYDESPISIDDRALSDGDRLYQDQIMRNNPDESFLSPEQEQELAQTVQLGLAASKKLVHMDQHNPEFEQLLKEANEGQAARDELVITNLRLAAWLVRETMDFDKERAMKGQRDRARGKIVRDLGSLSGGTLGYGDRMQVASIGLMKAASKFKGEGSFTGFALWAMESELIRAIGKVELPMRLPTNQSNDINRYERSQRELTLSGNMDPSYQEIGDLMDAHPGRVAELEGLKNLTQQVSFEELAEGLAKLRGMGGLEDEYRDDLTVADVLVDSETDQYSEASELAALNELGQRIDNLLARLSDREQQVLIMRFGLEGDAPMTLAEVAEQFGVIPERIRQIQNHILKRLKRTFNNSGLRDILYEEVQDTQYGLRPELKLSHDEDELLGITKPKPRTRDYIWEQSASFSAPAVRTYTLEEYRRLKGE